MYVESVYSRGWEKKEKGGGGERRTGDLKTTGRRDDWLKEKERLSTKKLRCYGDDELSHGT